MTSKCGLGSSPVPGTESRKIHFVVSARDLPLREGRIPTKPDPYVEWSQRSNFDVVRTVFNKAGVTKHRVNEQNPNWYDHVFSYDWIKGTGQVWHFEVIDYDVLNKDDNIFFVDVEVDDYVLKNKEDLNLKISTGGRFIIKKCVPQRFRLSAERLPKLDPFEGLSDPYVKCYWSFGADGPQTLFATTKTIKNVENAEWEEVFEFPNYQAGTNQYWTFKVFDKDPLPRDDVIGEASVEVDKYLNLIKIRRFAVLKLSTDPKNEAELIVTNA